MMNRVGVRLLESIPHKLQTQAEFRVFAVHAKTWVKTPHPRIHSRRQQPKRSTSPIYSIVRQTQQPAPEKGPWGDSSSFVVLHRAIGIAQTRVHTPHTRPACRGNQPSPDHWVRQLNIRIQNTKKLGITMCEGPVVVFAKTEWRRVSQLHKSETPNSVGENRHLWQVVGHHHLTDQTAGGVVDRFQQGKKPGTMTMTHY